MNQLKGKPGSQEESETTLRKIRNLLTENKQVKCTDFSKVSDKQALKYLQQSFKLLGNESTNQNNLINPQLVKKKIESANVLLAEEPSMFKGYVKNKIQSEVFGGRALSSNNKEYVRLIQMRQDLQKKNFDEKKEYLQKIEKMIYLAKKNKKQGYKNQIPLQQIQQLVNKQKIDYDSILKEQYSEKSKNNQIKNLESFHYETQPSHLLQSNKPIHKNSQGKIQVLGEEQSEGRFFLDEKQKVGDKFETLFQKNSAFYSVFKQFLQIQLQKMEYDKRINQQQNLNFDNYKKPKHIFKFTNKLLNSQPAQTASNMSIGYLSQLYKFKPFLMSSVSKQLPNPSIIKKTISKRIGQTNKYHMKQCIIQNNIFYYSDQQDGIQINKQKMKSIEITISYLEIIQTKKEEGSFFSKKEEEIEAVILKGSSRNFTYELKQGQGQQLTKQINKINLKRLHNMSCILRGATNKSMQKIIDDNQYNLLDLSDKYIRHQDQYPNKEYRSILIKLILGLIPYLTKIERLNLSKCKLNSNQLLQILNQCEKHFDAITSIDISNNKLDKETVKSVLALVKKCPKTLTLNMGFCELNDEIIEFNSQNFAEASNKLLNLNLEGNQITSKSIKSMKVAFESNTSELKTINVNNCSIEEFSQICNFIKNSNKLQTFLANGCKITFTNFKQMEDLLTFTQEKSELKKIQVKKNLCAGTIKWFEQIGPYLQLTIDLTIKSANSQSLESKYLKVQCVNK